VIAASHKSSARSFASCCSNVRPHSSLLGKSPAKVYATRLATSTGTGGDPPGPDEAVAFQINPGHTGAVENDSLTPPLSMLYSLDQTMDPSAPIFGFNDAREDIVRTVVERVVSGTKDSLLALNDAAYHETKRLEASRKPSDQKELAEWQKLARSLGRLTETDRRGRLEELAKRYGDVAGNFNPRVFQLSTRPLPPIVTALHAPHAGHAGDPLAKSAPGGGSRIFTFPLTAQLNVDNVASR
jgi:hypothetical protein